MYELGRRLGLHWLSAALGVTYCVLGIACAFIIIEDRDQLYIRQRNPAFLLSEILAMSVSSVATNTRWYLLYSGDDKTDISPLMTLGTAIMVSVYVSGGILRLNQIVLKLAATPQAPATLTKSKLIQKRLPPSDLRTVRSQRALLTGAYVLLFPIWMILLYKGEKLCFRICKTHNAPIATQWFFMMPYTITLGGIMSGAGEKYKKLGKVDERLGLVREINDNGMAQNLLLAPSNILWLVVDLGGIPLSYMELAALLAYLCNWASLYISYIRPAWEFSRASRAESEVMPTLNIAVRNMANDAALLEDPMEAVPEGSVEQLLGILNQLLDDARLMETLMKLSKAMLSEEPVRCAVAIAQLRRLGVTKQEKEQMRQGWLDLLRNHINDQANLPIKLEEQKRRELSDYLSKCARRMYMFNDDCLAVREKLDEALGWIARDVYNVVFKLPSEARLELHDPMARRISATKLTHQRLRSGSQGSAGSEYGSMSPVVAFS